jgi:uncharacterized membrane protein YebE (DUF533 family)
LQQLLDAAMQGGLHIPDPASRAESRQWLEAMAAAALSDGTLQPQERHILQAAAARSGLSPYDLDQILKSQETMRIQAARAALRKIGR